METYFAVDCANFEQDKCTSRNVQGDLVFLPWLALFVSVSRNCFPSMLLVNASLLWHSISKFVTLLCGRNNARLKLQVAVGNFDLCITGYWTMGNC